MSQMGVANQNLKLDASKKLALQSSDMLLSKFSKITQVVFSNYERTSGSNS